MDQAASGKRIAERGEERHELGERSSIDEGVPKEREGAGDRKPRSGQVVPAAPETIVQMRPRSRAWRTTLRTFS
jgi:hypothetical protein